VRPIPLGEQAREGRQLSVALDQGRPRSGALHEAIEQP
jgi:hypothetical protein